MIGHRTVPRAFLLCVSGLVALSASSCAHSPVAPCAEQTSVVISVGSGLTPSVSWTPSCEVGYVGFERLEGQSRLAMFQSYDADNQIPSGRTYGGGQTVNTSFSQGSTYRVTVGLLIGGDAVATLGTHDFTR